jgi:hypothetical protein
MQEAKYMLDNHQEVSFNTHQSGTSSQKRINRGLLQLVDYSPNDPRFFGWQ